MCLFVCLATKAVHLELVSDLTTEAFIAALQRFSARRGRATDIFTDNASNFIGADRELKELHALAKSREHNGRLSHHLAEEGTCWHFIPPRAPHFGGLWEAGVKSVKRHLCRTIGLTTLTFEELYTLLTQVEACLNSRPITPMSSDPNDMAALTPGHFLIGEAITSIPEPDYTPLKMNTLSRWQLIQRLHQQFWKRWQSEYLSQLQQRPKWQTKQQDLAIGDLVLIKEDNTPPLKWAMGRIILTHPGRDGCVRVATVRTSQGVQKRPIVKICPLPPLS